MLISRKREDAHYYKLRLEETQYNTNVAKLTFGGVQSERLETIAFFLYLDGSIAP